MLRIFLRGVFASLPIKEVLIYINVIHSKTDVWSTGFVAGSVVPSA